MDKIIGMDVDGVCADLLSVWLYRYNKDYSDGLKLSNILDWNLHQFVKPECGTRMYNYIEDPTIYDGVLPIEGAMRGVKFLRELGYRVVFVTSSTVGCSGRKYKWLKDFGFIEEGNLKDYVEMVDKSLINSDYLVDDYTVNIESFKGIGVLFSQPYNKMSQIMPRVNNWRELTRYFEVRSKYD
jgi:5'(3')-deoxyribonucleotidase